MMRLLSSKNKNSFAFLQKYKKFWIFLYIFYFHLKVCIVKEICKRLKEEGYIDANYRRIDTVDRSTCNSLKFIKK